MSSNVLNDIGRLIYGIGADTPRDCPKRAALRCKFHDILRLPFRRNTTTSNGLHVNGILMA